MQFVNEMLPYLLSGAVMTLKLTFASMALALLLGLAVALLRLSRNRLVRFFSGAYVEIIRGTPLLVQLFIIYYGLPQYDIRLEAFTAGVIGLSINYSAYLAEVFRAGILAIDKGQWEAGCSIGLSRAGLLRYVIVPQAARIVLPPIGNYFISMLKDSALVSTISIVELMRAAQLRVAITFRAMDIYLLVAVLYFAMSYPCALLIRYFERKVSRGHA
jgi:His/Glu/Gln/Arg/opine family amino acid ABC transporter permease subunit